MKGKKLICGVLAGLLAASMVLPVTAAEIDETSEELVGAVVASNDFGNGVSWELDSAGTLRIKGQGVVPTCEPGVGNPALFWGDYRNIKNVIVEEGITEIGDYGFQPGPTVIDPMKGKSDIEYENISLPSTVTYIGWQNLGYANMTINMSACEFAQKSKQNPNKKPLIFKKGAGHNMVEKQISKPDGSKDGEIDYVCSTCGAGLELTYNYFDNGCSIKSVTQNSVKSVFDFKLPEKIDGKPVTTIASAARFKEGEGMVSEWQGIMSVTFPETLTSIMPNTLFNGNEMITSLTMPASVQSVTGQSFFSGMRNLETLTIKNKNISIGGRIAPIACGKKTTIYGYSGSTAEQYASLSKIPFKVIGSEPVNGESPFKDVTDKTAYYYDPVLWAVEKGITTGTSATTFAPNAKCTRGQVVTFLWRAYGQPKPKTSVNPFTDVKSDAYYYDAVLWAYENKITTGTSSTTFSPESKVTRAQFVTFLWRAEGEPTHTIANPFVDLPAGQYYTDAVLWAFEKGVTTGTSKDKFSPNAVCTRGQVVTFIYRDLK